jgi:hypothetical protein
LDCLGETPPSPPLPGLLKCRASFSLSSFSGFVEAAGRTLHHQTRLLMRGRESGGVLLVWVGIRLKNKTMSIF